MNAYHTIVLLFIMYVTILLYYFMLWSQIQQHIF